MALSSHLTPGMDSADVRALQQFLNANGYPVAPSGHPGSAGMETTYFGPGTVAALQKFQAAQGIVSSGDPASTGYGAVGPRTLAAINSYQPQTGPTNVPPTQNRVDPSAVYEQYGYNPNQMAVNKASTALDGFLGLIQSGAAGQSGIPAAEMNRIINDPTQVGFYLNALAYGGYTLQDVFKDMVWQSHQNAGTGNMQAIPEPISGMVEAHVYKASPDYKQVQSTPLLSAIPPTIAGLDSTVTTVPLLQVPEDAFTNVKPLTVDQFRDQMKDFKDATYEIALKMATATNDAQHTQAMSDWNSLKSQIEGRLGINLSDNAIAAWNQISSFAAQAAQRGIAGSGIQEKQVDDYLKQQMQANTSVRKYFANYEDTAKANYYQNYASPAEIRELIGKDPAKAEAYGLIPNPEAKAAMSLDALKKQFPGTPEDQLQAMINKYMDTNGNFYSKLYGNYAQSEYVTGQNYQTWQSQQEASKLTTDAANANKQYSDPNNPFLKPQGSGVGPTIPSNQMENTYKKTTTPVTPTPAPTQQPLQKTAPMPVTPTPPQQPLPTTAPKNPATTTPVKPSTFTALSSLGSTTNTPSYSSNPSFSGANFSIGTQPTTPKPSTNPYIQQSAAPAGLTSGGSSGLGSLFSGAASSVGNFFKKLF